MSEQSRKRGVLIQSASQDLRRLILNPFLVARSWHWFHHGAKWSTMGSAGVCGLYYRNWFKLALLFSSCAW